jgi:LacI family repressor for deo operon, udp, cdd, tsx, nupC, and nupG
MEKKANINDVAKYLGVATSTVSRALQNHPTISAKTKKLVLNAVRELNYSPNKIAANLRSGNGSAIGVIIPKINSNFMSNCIFGIENVIYPSGYNLIICQSTENYEKEVSNIRTLIDSQVSGILISVSNETISTDHLAMVKSNNIPLIMFDRIDESLEVDCIVNDDVKATGEAVEHLIDQGYTKIALLNGPEHIYVYKNRYNGYRQALVLNAMEPQADWIIQNINSQEEAYKATCLLLDSPNPPDAIFCASDILALGVLAVLKERNIRSPEEIGVVGYGNDIFGDLTTPTLTSIEQYPQEIGASAAQIMLQILADKNVTAIAKTISIRPRLIIRRSSWRMTRE